jgi:hypothetical protein
MGSIPRDAQLIVVCDVETRFKDAARDFGSQKGASPEQVAELSERPEDLEGEYLDKPSSPPSGLHRHRTKSFLALPQCLQVCAIR